ncbi:MAG: Ig-like domain-containing protein [Gemmatimonadales bacterium]
MSRRVLPALAVIGALAACGDGGVEPGPTVASVSVMPASVSLAPGGTAQLTATASDSRGSPVSATVAWSSNATGVATVSTSGLVTAVGAGTARITAAVGSVEGFANVTVTGGQNVQLAVQLTQAVQNATGTLPLVEGRAAAANLLVSATPAIPGGVRVAFHLLMAGGVVFADTIQTGPLAANVSLESPSAQVLIPANFVSAGVSWEATVVDAALRAGAAPAIRAPALAPAPLTIASLPTLPIRFVPMMISNPSSSVGNVDQGNLEQYLVAVRAVLPTGPISATVASPIATSASFGTPPSGGDPAFWVQLVQELDLARTLDPSYSAHYWYGVIRPPSGFNQVTNGGWSAIPSDPNDVGPGGRTSSGVAVGWFNNQRLSAELVSHELAHALGRRHAPSCGAGNPLDSSFPYPGGAIGRVGHDVASWARGVTALATPIPSTIGDLMGYCSPQWVSDYTWDAIRQWRQASGPITGPPAGRMVVVTGRIGGDGAPTIDPGFVTEGPLLPESRGATVRVRLLDGSGRTLAERWERAVRQEVGEITTFTALVPVSRATETEIASVVVESSGRAAVSPLGGDRPVVAIRTRRMTAGRTELRWDPDRAGRVLIRDAATGRVLGFGAGGRAIVPSDAQLWIVPSSGPDGSPR